MSQMSAHESVEELQAVVAGLLLAVDSLAAALTALATNDAAHGSLLAPHLAKVRVALENADSRAERALLLGLERGREAPASPGQAEKG